MTDLHAREAVAGDVVVLQRAQPAVIDEEAGLLPSWIWLRRRVGLPPVVISTPARSLLLMSLSSSVPSPPSKTSTPPTLPS
jgi:hypothetical protein